MHRARADTRGRVIKLFIQDRPHWRVTPDIRESSRGPWGATRRNRTTATPCKCVPFQGWARVDDGVVSLS